MGDRQDHVPGPLRRVAGRRTRRSRRFAGERSPGSARGPSPSPAAFPVWARTTRGLRPRLGSRGAQPPAGTGEPRSSASGRLPNRQQADLGHVLHGEADALAAETAVLDAAVRHVVHAPARHVADDDAADVELVPCAHGLVEVACEEAGLEAEVAVVDPVQRLVEVAEPIQDGHGPERLLAYDGGVPGHVLEERRVEEGALPLPAAEDAGAGVHGVLDPAVQTRRLLLRDHRPDVRLLLPRVSLHELARGRDQAVAEGVVDLFVDEDPLDADAALAGLVEGAEDDAAGYAIARKLETRNRGLSQALSNISDGKSMLTVAEGALSTVMDITQEMKEKAKEQKVDGYIVKASTIPSEVLSEVMRIAGEAGL